MAQPGPSKRGSGRGEHLAWCGTVTSVQPRILLLRSFDERQRSYLGFVLRLDGTVGPDERPFSIAIGPKAQEKHQFKVGDEVSGEGLPVVDPRKETAELFRARKLKPVRRGASDSSPPPWHGSLPSLSVYRDRGHRRLDARTYRSKCSTCIWGCEMPVELIIDHWKPDRKKHRRETFCYGPLSCPLYRAGPTRKVPDRSKGMLWEEEDWVDEQSVSHRGPDE